ncbi:MAG: PEP-CTERM sorting domain-containing protein, partial [Smithellaceae bacterium]
FGGGGLSFTLNFGTVLQNSGTETAYLQILNDVLGPSDFLSGSFSSDSPDWVDFDFIYAGFNEFKDLGAGQSFGGLMLALNTTELGTFSETITLSALGYNASGYKHTFDIALIVQGNVVEATATPEPTTMLLLGFGLIGLVVIRRKIQT